jgi:polysaccharide chain length determinant protein (PEP-CTERM system associated)
MIQNRELTVDDYVAMLRRRLWVILIPALIAPALGFGISYLIPPKYTSQSTVLVEGQKVPAGYVKPPDTEDLMQRISTLQQQVLSRNQLQSAVEHLGLVNAAGTNVEDVMDDIRKNVTVTPVLPDASTAAKAKPGQSPVLGFQVGFTSSNPRVAQQVCNQLTSMFLEENLKVREQLAQGTTEFLSRQVEEAKHDLDEQDAKLAAFKREHVGQLPGDEDNNFKILMGLNSQLDANTQTINRAQQDRSYAEAQLATMVSQWNASSQSSTSPQALEQQLAQAQASLLQLQGRYTDDHPDVVKAKNDIKELKKRLADVNSAKPDTSTQKASAMEPPEIRQLRVQIHQYEQTISQATAEQKRLQDSIRTYQSRVSLSPAIEEQYKQLTRDYDTAQKFYTDLLGKKSESAMTTDMVRDQQGEQFRLMNPANFPSSPSFPNRLIFAGGGLGIGAVLGLGLALWLELKDKAIRNELDVEAVMELPMLISLPWLMEDEEVGKKKPGGSKVSRESVHETVQV